MGGIGKTQTAIEYAYRYFYDQSAYEWVFWIKADTDLNLATDIGGLADKLELPGAADRKLDEKVAAVLHWLETTDRWLLIFDNADRPELVKPYRPRNPNGRILLTSRAQVFDRVGIAEPIEVQDMGAAEAIEFLFKRTDRQLSPSPLLPTSLSPHSPDTEAERKAAAELAQELGYLPLALEQAGAFIYQKKLRFGQYLQLYRQRRLELLQRQQPITGDSAATATNRMTQ